MRWLFFAAAAVSLSGCGIPPVVSLATLALDLASYGSTGKTMTDHGISMVLREDCALLRVLDGPICVEESETGTAERKLARDDDSPASRRLAHRDDDEYRANLRGAAQTAEADGLNTLQLSFLADPAMEPGLGTMRLGPSGEPVLWSASAELSDVLAAADYLGDGVRLSGGTRDRRQLSGARNPAHGIVSGRRARAGRDTNG